MTSPLPAPRALPAPSALPTTPILAIEHLSVTYAPRGRGALIRAVRDVSLRVAPHEALGVVGESGSGKTQLFSSVMALLPKSALLAGSVRFDGQELMGLPTRQLNRLRGSKFTMIFQDPRAALTPHVRIGVQLAEGLVSHSHMSWRAAELAALRMLDAVQIPEPKRRLRQYPHELSGGMLQRVMIAMSLMCHPLLLIADEPTTALDVTTQAQIIELLSGLRHDLGMAVVLISHDLGLLAQFADRIVVMYAGRVVENTGALDVLHRARHPYTVELLKCVPNLTAPRIERMPSLSGQPPDASSSAAGCDFAPRCPRAAERCRVERPLLRDLPASTATCTGAATAAIATAQAACHFPVTT